MKTIELSRVAAGLRTEGRQSPALKRTFKFIQKNWHKPINVKHLATASKLSRRGLYKAFVKHFGHGPGSELRCIRIKHAEQLLIQTDWNLESVAEMCGFAAANSFFVAFKREIGISPGQYREVFRRSAPRLAMPGARSIDAAPAPQPKRDDTINSGPARFATL